MCRTGGRTSSLIRACIHAAIACLGGASVAPAAVAQSVAALRFHGTGTDQQDRVRIAIDDNSRGPDGSTVCDVGVGSFTIEFWVRGWLVDNATPSFGGDVEVSGPAWIDGNIVVDRDIWGSSDADWGISLAGGRVRFGTGRGDPPSGNDTESTIEGSVMVLDGAWHHVACVRQVATGRKRIVVDGDLDFESQVFLSNDNISYPNGGVANSVTPWNPYLVLGAEKHDAGPDYPSLDGWFDELRIWSIAREPLAIAEDRAKVLPAGTPGLVGSYRFEEGGGTAIADTSGSGGPQGLLIAGVPGNGEWALASANPTNTAPIASSLLGDLNGDGTVNGADLALLLGAWGACSGCSADLDGNGIVDGADLATVLGGWTS
ncbi:MAG: hypothetical protein JNL80_11435 [Phycisphaerae bacterium]|nr:hypothetical protein [Phycisphaerae bacterium]